MTDKSPRAEEDARLQMLGLAVDDFGGAGTVESESDAVDVVADDAILHGYSPVILLVVVTRMANPHGVIADALLEICQLVVLIEIRILKCHGSVPVAEIVAVGVGDIGAPRA